MFNKTTYIIFSITILFLQILVLNNITFTSYVVPLLYVSIITIMPLKSTRLGQILIALPLGMIMDLSMGTFGLNVAATLPVAYFRENILYFCNESVESKKDGFPSWRTIGHYNFITYVVLMSAVHSVLFFLLESLTFQNFTYQLARFSISLAITLILNHIILRIFKKKIEEI